MKTIYILVIIVLLGASVFTYIYTKEPEKTETAPNAQNIQAPNSQNFKAPVITTTGAGLNPEHGLPNHRCDLPVGAPLTVSAEQKVAAPAKPKTNPQHGMPGHRCDLAVGAPL